MTKFIAAIAIILAILAALFFLPLPAPAQVATVTLDWTAPGDDNNIGTATTYQMRYSTTRPDTSSSATLDSWWNAATPVSGLPAPLVAGTTQSVTIAPSGGFLSGQSYYFVMKACDEVPNCSPYSNVAVFAVPDTLAPRRIIDLRRR